MIGWLITSAMAAIAFVATGNFWTLACAVMALHCAGYEYVYGEEEGHD